MSRAPTVSEWWRRRMGRWIDVARRQVARGEGRRYKAPTRLQIVTARYNALQAQKDNPRDLLRIDRARRGDR